MKTTFSYFPGMFENPAPAKYYLKRKYHEILTIRMRRKIIDDDYIVSSTLSPATPVPWETDALPVVGSTILFGLGVWAKRKSAKPIQKIDF